MAAGAFFIAGGAVVIEVVAGSLANSEVPSWAEWAVPLGWPRWARVAWWSFAALAAWVFRTSLARMGFRPKGWVTALTVAPFLVFAAGIAAGAEWFTFH